MGSDHPGPPPPFLPQRYSSSVISADCSFLQDRKVNSPTSETEVPHVTGLEQSLRGVRPSG